MTRPTRRTALVALAFAGCTFLATGSAVRADNGVQAENVIGKFGSYKNGVLSLTDVTGGKVKGSRDINMPDGISCIVFLDANHMKVMKTPDCFGFATVGQQVEITIDTRMRIASMQIGGGVKGKGKKKK